MDKKYYEYSKYLTEKIKEEYYKLEKQLLIDENIKRNTRLTMGNSTENCIAKLINKILNKKEYDYIIDAYVSIGKKNSIRPDIMIINNNTIVGIIEVKSQLGYSGPIKVYDFIETLQKIKDASYNEKLKYKDKTTGKYIFLKVADSLNIYITVLLESNHKKNSDTTAKNFINNKNVNYYIFYNDGNWYNNLDYKDLYQKNKHNFIKFVNDIEKLK